MEILSRSRLNSKIELFMKKQENRVVKLATFESFLFL